MDTEETIPCFMLYTHTILIYKISYQYSNTTFSDIIKVESGPHKRAFGITHFYNFFGKKCFILIISHLSISEICYAFSCISG